MSNTANTDVFYVTYSKDAEWFRWSLLTVTKHLAGIRRVVVVCPDQDTAEIAGIIAENGSANVLLFPIPDWWNLGYYWQQWVKMRADEFTDADLIAHIDSDVFIKSPCSVSDFLADGKPAWLWAYFSDVTDTPWQVPTQLATGFACPREFMQGFPFILRRDTYAKARHWLESQHNISTEEYIRRSPRMSGPPGFSEFNFLGNVAWTLQQGEYHWIDRNREAWPSGFHQTRQFWSHAPIEDHLPELRQMIAGGTAHHPRVTNRGWWVLSNDTHISKWVEETGRLDFDTPFMNRVCEHIRPGDVVVDVGAFIGDHTMAYAKATHGVDGGRVFAFEPNPPAFACLEKNMAPLEHVECFNVALAGMDGEAAMAIDPNAGASHLVPGSGIPLRTLDSFEIRRLKLIKIDAEGMETDILAGAQETIARCRPILVMEINPGALARQSSTPADIQRLLAFLNYRIEGWEDGSPQFDIFCFPR